MTQQDALATLDMVTGTFYMFSSKAFVLIDPRATHSFILMNLLHVCMTLIPLNCHIEICTPTGESLWAIQVLKGGLFVWNQVMEVDLILLDLQRLNVIFAMDLLAANFVLVDCFWKKVTFK